MGEACSCSSALRSSNLQIRSLPFDWLFGSTFLGRVDMIVNDFENFLRIEDLELIGDNGIKTHLCDIYRNNFNGLIFNHDFLNGLQLESEFEKVSLKYKRRENRLYEFVNKSEKILVVWIDTPGVNWSLKKNEDFIEGHKKLCQKFPHKQIDLLVFCYEKGLDFKNKKYEKLNDYIEKYTFDYHKTYHKKKLLPDYAVDEKMLAKILKKYELDMTLKEKWENYCYKKFKNKK